MKQLAMGGVMLAWLYVRLFCVGFRCCNPVHTMKMNVEKGNECRMMHDGFETVKNVSQIFLGGGFADQSLTYFLVSLFQNL
jgi:hypothetical protein